MYITKELTNKYQYKEQINEEILYTLILKYLKDS